jgi:hypothetical protein
MTPLLIRGQWGLGDNIYARPFVKELAKQFEIYLDTPWPEIYEDLPVRFVLQPRALRTQMKNVRRQAPERWSPPPPHVSLRTVNYGQSDMPRRSIPQILAARFRADADWSSWDLPHWHSAPKHDRPIAVIKATTIRREWKSQARNPRPEYVNWIAQQLMQTHHVVAVGDIDSVNESLLGGVPPCHQAFLKGELAVTALIDLVRSADIVVGGVGWNVPMAVALKVKIFVVLGGRGGHNAPEIITDPAMDLSRIGYATPERYCRCCNSVHNCDKTIPNLADQWARFLTSAGSASTSARSNGGTSASAGIP